MYLTHKKMNITMSMRLEDHVTILFCRNLTSRIINGRNSILLHNCYIFLLKTVVIVFLQKLDCSTDHEVNQLSLVICAIASHYRKWDFTLESSLHIV